MRSLPLVLAGLLAGACGPSFHAIYEGNARFEHCYALEENPQAPMRDKADCWRDWSERYTYGQTRDRIQYATARYVALSQAPNIPTDEALMMAAPGMTPRVLTITAPAPTSALAPPPKVLDEGDAGTVEPDPRPSDLMNRVLGVPPDGGAPAIAPAPELPASACTSKCETSFFGCGAVGCDTATGEAKKKCDACKAAYAGCMRACFK